MESHPLSKLIHQLGLKFYLFLLAILLLIFLIEMPASIPASFMASKTSCQVTPYSVEGSIWNGSAILGLSAEQLKNKDCGKPKFITERIHWITTCHWMKGFCEIKLDSLSIHQPIMINLDLTGIKIGAAEIDLPHNVIEVLADSLVSLKPRANISLSWDVLSISGFVSPTISGLVHIKMLHLSSLTSSIKDLGSYEVKLNLSKPNSPWTLASIHGPLLLSGSGELSAKGVHFSGQASAEMGYQDSLHGLMSLMGQRNGDVYRIQF